MSARCAEWIDGNGNSESAPHAEYFYADGTVSSNPGFSLSEVFITCPTEVTACQAENAVCEGELAAATDPLRGADAEWPTGARAPWHSAVSAALLTACCAMSDGSAEFQAVTACVNAAITGR